MAEYGARIVWKRGDAPFVDGKYSRVHQWSFDGGIDVVASSSPHVVPLPFASAEAVDPEEAFVASLSSCHMLFFLAFAAKRKFVIDFYIDTAVGVMEKNQEGKLSMTKVTLRPAAVFTAEHMPSRREIDDMHHEAHEACYIANSVKTEIETRPVYDPTDDVTAS